MTRAPWVLVATGFVSRRGGMDRANAELASFLHEAGHPVHLVTHAADEAYHNTPGMTLHLVRRPGGSDFAGEFLLDRRGRRVAREVAREHPGTRVVVNGGCCRWADVNWVHCVHQAWPCIDRGAPAWFRVKNRLVKAWARMRERVIVTSARVVVANSERTRLDLIRHLEIPGERLHTVYLGTDPAWGPVTGAERREARAWLGLQEGRPVVVFVGALSHDDNKGLDTLFSAWKCLCLQPDWDADLIVAGGGNGLRCWQRRVDEAGLSRCIRLLGFTTRVREVLAAADLLVSPVRYEAYGLNVQEAISRGVPALVSGRAGIAERYPADLAEMVLQDPEDAADLAGRLQSWRPRREEWKARFARLGEELRRWTWRDMAERIVVAAHEVPSAGGARCGDFAT